MLGSENSRAVVERIRDSPKVNFSCALSRDKVYGLFLFEEKTVNVNVYCDMLQL
jgi:hypothetical protein